MAQDVRNPAFSRAIPHVGLVFCPLLKVVIFGSFGESRNPIPGPEMVPFGDSEWTHFGPDLGIENRGWDRTELVFGRSQNEMR